MVNGMYGIISTVLSLKAFPSGYLERFNILHDGVKLALSCLCPMTVATQSDKNTATECSESRNIVPETSDNDLELCPEPLEAQITYHLGTSLAKTVCQHKNRTGFL